MTERQDALCDRSYAEGMRIAVKMMGDCEKGPSRIHAIADRLSSEALKVIIATRGEDKS